MATTVPSDVQAESIGAASQFIRTVGRKENNEEWREKARKLDDLLGHKNIVIDSTLAAGTDGEAHIDPIGTNQIRLASDVPLTSAGGKPLTPSDPDFVKLAGVLHRLADRMLGHGFLVAYGGEIDFYAALIDRFKKYFPDAGDDAGKSIQGRLDELKKNAEKKRKETEEKNPPHVAGPISKD